MGIAEVETAINSKLVSSISKEKSISEDLIYQDIIFMKEAIQEALKASIRGDYGIGAVVVLDNAIISRAGNGVVSENRIRPYAHAEFLALDNLRDTPHDNIDAYRKMRVYTTVAPCPQCWGRLMVAGVQEVIYGLADKPSTQDFIQSIPDIFKQQAPTIRESYYDMSEQCHEILDKTWRKIDEKFFRTK